MGKLKVLLLGSHDSTLTGHIGQQYSIMSNEVDAYMVTLTGFEDGKKYALFGQLNNRQGKRLQTVLENLYRWLYCFFLLGCIPSIDEQHREYCFYDFYYYPFTARSILKKLPKGFCPDVISVHWHQGFVNPKMIRRLHELTGAKIIYQFVDESPLTGGCHYPIDCKGYLSHCENCPALKHGKKLATKQLTDKIKQLKGLPLFISGSPYDLRLAADTALFCESVKFPLISFPKIQTEKQAYARRSLGIDESAFVVFVGVGHLTEARKGLNYTIAAINKVATRIQNLVVLVAGRSKLEMACVTVRNLGFVKMEMLSKCFSAADCFLSTSIADSGPMMVNFAMACGTPVVSFPIGIADSLVVHLETGYLARYKDAEDVANGIVYLAQLDAESRSRMSERCIEFIKEQSNDEPWYRRIRTFI